MKYRRKPIIVEAIHWTGNNSKEVDDFIKESPTVVAFDPNREEYAMSMHDGIVKAAKGDYIIKNIEGDFYPCKAEVFEGTYDKVEEPVIKKRKKKVIKG